MKAYKLTMSEWFDIETAKNVVSVRLWDGNTIRALDWVEPSDGTRTGHRATVTWDKDKPQLGIIHG